jgi:hypothetical protein
MDRTITLLSWNVNGVRAAHRKGFLDWLAQATPDILCLQETRAEEAQLPAALAQPSGYHTFWNSARRKKGYSGTALLTRAEPLDVQFGLDIEEFDQEGRTIIARYPTFTLINCYFPNGGRDHRRVPFKLAFYDAFLEKCEQLRALPTPRAGLDRSDRGGGIRRYVPALSSRAGQAVYLVVHAHPGQGAQRRLAYRLLLRRRRVAGSDQRCVHLARCHGERSLSGGPADDRVTG